MRSHPWEHAPPQCAQRLDHRRLPLPAEAERLARRREAQRLGAVFALALFAVAVGVAVAMVVLA